MRIVGGRWKGRSIAAPDGRGTRPTTDRVRESLSSMVLSAFDLDLSGVSVLDGFAGSGALGLEMLSRGAKNCSFVDEDARACKLVKANLASLGAQDSHTEVIRADFSRAISPGRLRFAPYALVLLDPPYAYPADELSQLIVELSCSGMLFDDALILYERSGDAPGLTLEDFNLLKERSFGTSAVELWRFGGR